MIKDLLSDFIGSLLADIFSMSQLQKYFTKTITGKVTGKKEDAGGETGGPKVKFGGLFDLSDETTFGAALASVSHEAMINVCQFLTSGLIGEGTERRFRLMIANLYQYEAKDAAGNTINLGTEALIKFSRLDNQGKVQLCQAIGLDQSLVDQISRAIESVKEKLLDPRFQQMLASLEDFDQRYFGPGTAIADTINELRQRSEKFRTRHGG